MSTRIMYQDVAPGAAEDATVSGPNQSWTDPALMPASTGGNTDRIATVEWNLWTLDGSFKAKDDQVPAFWSTELSGSDGSFANPPTITISFTQNFSSLGIYLVFDFGISDYCNDLQITWYQNGTQIAQESYQPDSVKYFCAKTVTAYDEVEIVLNSTNLPYRYAKLSQVLFGLVREFDMEDLVAIRATQEVNLISEEVAINTLDFDLDSNDDLGFMFQFKQPVLAYNNNNLIGTFYIADHRRSGPTQYSISCVDALGVLDESTVAARMLTNYNAMTLIQEILASDFDLDMDASLQSATVTGYLPPCTRREALQQICFAIGAAIDTSGAVKIKIFEPASSSPETIPDDRVFIGGSVTMNAVITAIRVTAHSYSISGSGPTVVVGGVTYYDTQTVTEIANPDATASDKQYIVEVTDATLVSPSNVAAVAQGVYDYYIRRIQQHMRIVLDDELPGDRIEASTAWGTTVEGNIERMDLQISTITVADCEVRGS